MNKDQLLKSRRKLKKQEAWEKELADEKKCRRVARLAERRAQKRRKKTRRQSKKPRRQNRGAR